MSFVYFAHRPFNIMSFMKNETKPTPNGFVYLVYGLGWLFGLGLELAYLGLTVIMLSENDFNRKPEAILVVTTVVLALLVGGQSWVLFTTFRDHRRAGQLESSVIAKLWGGTIILVFLGVGSCVAIIFSGYSGL